MKEGDDLNQLQLPLDPMNPKNSKTGSDGKIDETTSGPQS